MFITGIVILVEIQQQTWNNQAAHAIANSVYMLIIDSVDEWEAVRDMLYENNLDVDHWIGLTQKRNQILK